MNLENTDNGYRGSSNTVGLIKIINSIENTQKTTDNTQEKEKIEVSKSDSEPIYIGEYKDGLKHGHGKLIVPNGVTFEGEWKNDTINGYGIKTYNDEVYGKHYIITNKGYYYHNDRIIPDSLFTILVNNRVFQIGYYIEWKNNYKFFNGVQQGIRSKNEIKVIVNGKVKKRLHVSNNEVITEENWKSFYDKYK
jgi:hypothetical protein